MLEGKVLLTGGTGFLGRAILRRAELDGWPAEFTIYSRDPMRQAEVRGRFPKLHLTMLMGDVRDYDQLEAAVAGHDIVIHLAAMKHIPQAEWNATECLDVNIAGTKNVARAAIRTGVQKVVGISTDKACRPINTYGLTKAILEKLFQEADRTSRTTRFHLARYGNVVGSTGSVIPVWERQLEQSGAIHITDPSMTRFWVSADGAVDIVLKAMELPGGHIYIPRMKAMRIGDMATVLHPEAERTIIGVRPGEKWNEDLLHGQERFWAREHGNTHFTLRPMTEPPDVDGPQPYNSGVAEELEAGEFLAMVELGREI